MTVRVAALGVSVVARGPTDPTSSRGQTYFLVVGARDEAAPFTLDVDCIKE
jgi:hypothetical protein